MSSSSREKILAAVRQASQVGPVAAPLPAVPAFPGDDSVEQFTRLLTSIGGRVQRLADPAALALAIAQLYPASYRIASNLIPATVAVTPDTDHHILADLDLAVLRGELGVAENGAVWLPEANMLHRALPIVAQHLVLLLDQRTLVPTMHQAYAQLGDVSGYGVFLAGPSKTADIEQSLVIGAHGVRSLLVLLH